MMSSFPRLRALVGPFLLAVVVSGRSSGFLGNGVVGTAQTSGFSGVMPFGDANAIALPTGITAYPLNAMASNPMAGWFGTPGTYGPYMMMVPVQVPYGMFPEPQQNPAKAPPKPFRFDPAAPAFVPESARPSPTSQEQEESQPFYPASAVETAEATITLLSGAHLATFPLQVRRLDAVGEVDTPADSTCVVLGGPAFEMRREGGLLGILSRSVAETLQLPVGFVDKTFSFLRPSGRKGRGAAVGNTNNVVDCVVVDVASAPGTPPPAATEGMPSVAAPAGVPRERADEEEDEPPPQKKLRVAFSAVVAQLFTSDNAGRSGSADSRLDVLAEMAALLRPDNFSQFLSEDGSQLTRVGQLVFDNFHGSWQKLLEYVDANVPPPSYRDAEDKNSDNLSHLGDSLLLLVSWCSRLGAEAIARVAGMRTVARMAGAHPPAFVEDFVEKLTKRFAPLDGDFGYGSGLRTEN